MPGIALLLGYAGVLLVGVFLLRSAAKIQADRAKQLASRPTWWFNDILSWTASSANVWVIRALGAVLVFGSLLMIVLSLWLAAGAP